VRGIGMMLGIELVTDREKKTKAIEGAEQSVELAFDKGLLLLGCGENSIRFIPALTVGKDEIDCCLGILDECLKEVVAG
jgi:4-aminobutyrate aminotransferase